MHGPNKVTAPIARSTAYDFNCHLSASHSTDPRSHARNGYDGFGVDTTGEVRNVMPHEFLFEVVGGRQASAARMKAKSSLNGVVLPDQAWHYINRVARIYVHNKAELHTTAGRKSINKNYPLTGRQRTILNRALNRYIRYVGVAVTGIQGGPPTALQRQGFSATRGGLMTVVHRGETIPAGSRVAIEFDIQDILDAETDKGWIDVRHTGGTESGGVPRSKILPRLVRVNDDEEAVYDVKETLAGITKRHTVEPFELLMPDIATVTRGDMPFAKLG
jgi:hypothetical protein